MKAQQFGSLLAETYARPGSSDFGAQNTTARVVATPRRMEINPPQVTAPLTEEEFDVALRVLDLCEVFQELRERKSEEETRRLSIGKTSPAKY